MDNLFILDRKKAYNGTTMNRVSHLKWKGAGIIVSFKNVHYYIVFHPFFVVSNVYSKIFKI